MLFWYFVFKPASIRASLTFKLLRIPCLRVITKLLFSSVQCRCLVIFCGHSYPFIENIDISQLPRSFRAGVQSILIKTTNGFGYNQPGSSHIRTACKLGRGRERKAFVVFFNLSSLDYLKDNGHLNNYIYSKKRLNDNRNGKIGCQRPRNKRQKCGFKKLLNCTSYTFCTHH